MNNVFLIKFCEKNPHFQPADKINKKKQFLLQNCIFSLNVQQNHLQLYICYKNIIPYCSTASNAQIVGRIVFGEAYWDTQEVQLEVAYTIVNRISHKGYPNTLHGVVSQKVPGTTNHQYNTLDRTHHDQLWAYAKLHNINIYKNAIDAAENALCGHLSDQMSCGPVATCVCDPCTNTANNSHWCVAEKEIIGNHWFVCFIANTGQCAPDKYPGTCSVDSKR